MSKTAAKTKKALNASDIAAKLTRWSRLKRDSAALETDKCQDEKLNRLIEKHAGEMAPFVEQYDDAIETLDEKAAAIQGEILAWFEKRSKSTKVETSKAIAELVVGTKLGNRDIDKQKLAELCKKKGVDVWEIAQLMVGRADQLLGKKDVDAISTRETLPSRTASVKLK